MSAHSTVLRQPWRPGTSPRAIVCRPTTWTRTPGCGPSALSSSATAMRSSCPAMTGRSCPYTGTPTPGASAAWPCQTSAPSRRSSTSWPRGGSRRRWASLSPAGNGWSLDGVRRISSGATAFRSRSSRGTPSTSTRSRRAGRSGSSRPKRSCAPPYVRTEAELGAFLATLDDFLRFFMVELGGVPTDPLVIRAAYAPACPSAAPALPRTA